MIYLASVYSLNADEALMEERYQYALKRATEFTKEGLPIFCPIIHSHPMSADESMPRTFDFWEKIDYKFLDCVKELWVLMMNGWEDSIGVQAEIAYARKLGIPIIGVVCEDSPPAGIDK